MLLTKSQRGKSTHWEPITIFIQSCITSEYRKHSDHSVTVVSQQLLKCKVDIHVADLARHAAKFNVGVQKKTI